MARIITTLLPAICLISSVSQLANAHQDDDTDIDTRVDASFAIGIRSDAVVDRSEFWSMEGLMMGGEAYPYDKGLAMDDASLRTTWRINENQFLRSSLSAHSHSGSYEVQLEKLLIGHRVEDADQTWVFKAGLMNSDVTPSANWHSSTDSFTESPLLADAFFGRHSTDTGLSVNYLTNHWNSGIAIWNGDAWPATAGEGSASIFSRLSQDFSGINLETGVWMSLSNAELRADDRYVDGHNHGGGLTTATPADIRFRGDTTMAGLYANLLIPITPSLNSGLSVEVINSKSQGDLIDASRQAQYETDHFGYAIEASLTMRSHTLLLRHEKLLLDNFMDGIAAPFLAEDAGLVSEHEPERLTIGWEWYLSRQITFKMEWIDDNTLVDSSERFAIGLSYNQNLWE